MVWLEIIVVLGAIFLVFARGESVLVYVAGLGLPFYSGIWSAYGVAASRRDPDYYTVVVAASALQAAGGMDYLVRSLVILCGVTRNIST